MLRPTEVEEDNEALKSAEEEATEPERVSF